MMLILCVVALLISKDALGATISDPDAKELKLAFVLSRHGERTPAEEEAALSKDRDLLRNLTRVEGYEGLINDGKRRAYEIGSFLRQRYGFEHRMLSKLYLQDEIAVRSTDKERTKMTASIAMAALYPPVGQQIWDGRLGQIWQPVPFTSVPIAEDFLRFYSNCGYYKELLQDAKTTSLMEEFLPYLDLIPILKRETGANFTEDPLLFQTLHDLFSSQVHLGLDIPGWAIPILPRLTEAATLSYRLYLRSEEMQRIAGGVLLNDFIQAANTISSGGTITKPIRYFSSHDFNLGALMNVSRVLGSLETLPEYGALLALELYQSRVTGKYSVLPVYVPQVGASHPIRRRIEGCDEFCDYDFFRNITKDNLLPEREFYTLCNIRTEL